MKKYGKHICAAVALILIAVTVFISVNTVRGGGEEKLVTLERVFESVRIDDDTAYVKLASDETNYVVYEHKGLSLDVLSSLKKGDRVSLGVREDYDNFVNVIIYDLSVDDKLVLDSKEHYFSNNVSIVLLIASAVLGMLLAVFTVAILHKSAEQPTDENFCNQAGSVAKGFFFGTAFGGVSGIIAYLVLYIIGRMGLDELPFCILFLLFTLLGVLGIYTVMYERFILKDRVYTYYAPFRKPKRVSVDDVERVDINLRKSPFRVEFFGKDGERLVKINDSGFVFKRGSFAASLAHFKLSKNIFLNRTPALRSVERMLVEQYNAYGTSAMSFKYRDVEYTISYDGGAFYVTNDKNRYKTAFVSVSSLAEAECLDGIAPANVWEHIYDVTLRT